MSADTQHGWRVQRWGSDPVWEEFPRPRPGTDEVLVAVDACGVGLTVLNCLNGDIDDDPALLPRVPGHEVVGRVIDAGPGRGGALVGRRVAAYTYLACGACLECMAGRDSRCERLRGWVGVHIDGGYAPFTVLPVHHAIPLPDEVDPVEATVVVDAGATSLHVCGTRAQVTPHDRVAVIGAGGGVGIHMVQMARLFGARVAGLDVDDAKLAALEELGVTPVPSRSFAGVDPDALWPDGRPTVVVDLVGVPDSLQWAANALATGGRMIVLTTFRDRTFPLDPRTMVFSEASVIASRSFSRAELATAGRLLAAGRIRAMLGGVAAPADVLELHEQLRRGSLLGRGALRWT
jgi:D-arabinose 1-dehydrogenase-like Zn-dependent alcohol dehydrogenase